MRFLHTADWHIGKALRGRSRLDEHERALNEVLDIATREKIDCLLMAGDIFDSSAPPADAERLVYRFLSELAARRIPAVLIGGNHDHPLRLQALRPLLDRMCIHVRPQVAAPADGGLIELEVRGERAHIAVLPWVPEHKVLDAALMMSVQADRSSAYADEVADIVNALCGSFSTSTVNILMGHVFVNGAATSGSERAVHLSLPYALNHQRFPATASYIALGHLHRPQEISAPSPTLYAGSLLQLDFGEQGQDKRVVIIDAKPGKKARFESIAIASGRRLRYVSGTIQELERIAAGCDHDDYLYVTVKVPKPKPGIADEVRSLLPHTVDVRIELPEREDTGETMEPIRSLTPEKIFSRFCEDRDGVPPRRQLLEAFTKLHAEASDAPC